MIRFHPAADLELSEAAAYYDQQKAGLGFEFLAEVRYAAALVSRYPEMAPRVHGAVRRKVLDRFPYSLLYSIEDTTIDVLAVAHHKRHPDYWLERLSEGT